MGTFGYIYLTPIQALHLTHILTHAAYVLVPRNSTSMATSCTTDASSAATHTPSTHCQPRRSRTRSKCSGSRRLASGRWRVAEPRSRRAATRPSLSRAASTSPCRRSCIWRSWATAWKRWTWTCRRTPFSTGRPRPCSFPPKPVCRKTVGLTKRLKTLLLLIFFVWIRVASKNTCEVTTVK